MQTTHATTIKLTPEELKNFLIEKFSAEYPGQKISVYFEVNGRNQPNDWRSELPLDYDLRGVTIKIERE